MYRLGKKVPVVLVPWSPTILLLVLLLLLQEIRTIFSLRQSMVTQPYLLNLIFRIWTGISVRMMMKITKSDAYHCCPNWYYDSQEGEQRWNPVISECDITFFLFFISFSVILFLIYKGSIFMKINFVVLHFVFEFYRHHSFISIKI